jgi:pSer/pThr/pTyr-binding forkhead associated (FHA) protein
MATLQKVGDKAQCPIYMPKMRIGRAPDNEIIIEDDAVSGYHAVIHLTKSAEKDNAEKYVIEDLGSTNKTYVNNKEISSHELAEGDVIRLGRTRLKFSAKTYASPQEDFQKTQKLSGNKISNFFFPK